MNVEVNSLEEIVEKSLGDPSLFLVAVKLSDSGNRRKIKIIVDGDKGITIDQCASISRKVSSILEENDSNDDSYVLEVTSPGLDHPLQLFRQYVKNVGRKVKVVLKDHTEKIGILKSVQDDFIEIDSETGKKNKKEKEKVVIPFDKIEKTNIQISLK